MENIGHKLALMQNETNHDSYLENEESKTNRIPPLRNIPDQNCSINNSFLTDNIEFFQRYIYGPTEDNICLKLFTHLNSCYCCFSVFSQTMRDFIHKRYEISVHAKGVAK